VLALARYGELGTWNFIARRVKNNLTEQPIKTWDNLSTSTNLFWHLERDKHLVNLNRSWLIICTYRSLRPVIW
jgi:hypothetical protein